MRFKPKLYFIHIIPYFFLLFSILLTVGCGKSNADIPVNSTNTAILDETEDMGQEYIDSITFVGDSNTAHLVSFGVLKHGANTTQVWLPKGNTIALDTEICHKSVLCPSYGRYMTIPEAAAAEKPKYLMLSFGTNGIASMDEKKFKFCYKSLIDALQNASPSTKIIVQSIYPVTSWYKGFSNLTVELANQWLLELAEECGIKYIDTASVLKDENNALREEYNSYHKDGYHINQAAAEQIINYIRTHGYR